MRFQSFFRRRGIGIPLIFGSAMVVTALAFSGMVPHAASLDRSTPALASAPILAPLATTSYADAVSRVAPAVVTIEVQKRAQASPAGMMPDEGFLQRFFGPDMPDTQPDQQPGRQNGRQRSAPVQEGLGSGVILTADGNIVTNNHVVDGADRVTVRLTDGREFQAKVVGTDPPTDLAVIHIDATDLPTLAIADSDRVRVGDVVLAVGNPLGIGQTVTMGIVSAKGRETDVDNSSYEDFIQTDAPINKGNSGGALVTTTGELVGINSQIMSPSGGSIGIGFAIPSNMARNVMTQLVSTGHVRRGMLGVTVQAITSDLARSLALPSVHGAIVDEVTAGGPAAKSGIELGDVILKVNGRPIDDSNSLRNQVSAMAPGSTVTLDVFRHGSEKQLSATLSQMPDAAAVKTGSSSGQTDLGMTLGPLTPSAANRLTVPRGTTGVAVTDVDPAGAAARAGIQPGDVLTQVDGHAVETAAQVHDALAGHHTRPVLATVIRGGQRFYIALPAN
jgi:serine protease Do